jgi:hypothetical protein
MATIPTRATNVNPMDPVQIPLRGQDKGDAVQMQNLASFSSVVAWLLLTMLIAVFVFVPSISYKATDAGSLISGGATGLATVIPITVLVLRAVPSAKTPWLSGEVVATLCSVVFNSMSAYIVRAPIIQNGVRDLVVLENQRWPVTLVSISTAVAFTIPLVIALRTAKTVEDRRRVKLCLATALWGPLFLTPVYLGLVSRLVAFIFTYVVFVCVLFIGASLFLDRKNQTIERSVPYAACYGWGLGISMVGFGIILTTISLSVLVLNIVLSVYSTFLLWCFWQMASRITTKRDESSFMLPGFFAVEMFQVQ